MTSCTGIQKDGLELIFLFSIPDTGGTQTKLSSRRSTATISLIKLVLPNFLSSFGLIFKDPFSFSLFLKSFFLCYSINNLKLKSSRIENNSLTCSLTFCRRNFFQEGGRVRMINVKEAFRRSLLTWKSWALNNLHPTSFVFFRSFSPVHFR